MSNHQFKKSEAEHHNELYALDRERERLGLQCWQMPANYSAKALSKGQPIASVVNDVDTQHQEKANG